MKLVVGLGNPGPEYEETRHNIGRKTAFLLAKNLGVPTHGFKSAKYGLIAKTAIEGVGPVEILLPNTYMNLSGRAVVDSFPSKDEDSLSSLIVIQDELDLPLGTVRISKGGGDGGHNGIKSVTSSLGSPNYIRIRIGIANLDTPRAQMNNVESFVLERFGEEELKRVEDACSRASKIAEDILITDFDSAANKWNGK